MAATTILLPAVALGLALTFFARLLVRALPERLRPKRPIDVWIMMYGLIFVFAFIVGTTVSAENANVSAARTAASNEANSIGELYWYAHSTRPPEHQRLQHLLRTYTSIVTHDEWPLLGVHKTLPAASAAVRAIRNNILDFQPTTSIEKAVYGNMLAEVATLFAARRIRNNIATAGGVAPVLINGLIFLGVLMLVFGLVTGSLGRRDFVLHIVYATMIVAIFFFVTDLNNPFKGTVQVGPDAYKLLFTNTFVRVT